VRKRHKNFFPYAGYLVYPFQYMCDVDELFHLAKYLNRTEVKDSEPSFWNSSRNESDVEMTLKGNHSLATT
jgi:hypothetical protein